MSNTTSDADLDFIAQALPAFISEAREQIEEIEQLLLKLEDDPTDRELLDALFRCAHTVKGSAGIFGLEKVVAFTHHVETLLDKMRKGCISLDGNLSSLLLACKDQILNLVHAGANEGADTRANIEARADLITQLHAAMGDGAGSATAAVVAVQAAPSSAQGQWLLSARFGTECFRNGMDPLSIIRYLGTVGVVNGIVCDRALTPVLKAIEPESCHLNVALGLETTADRQKIEAAFSFVREDCVLRLVEPAAAIERYAALIDAMPDRPLLGEVLVKIGAITAE